MSDMTTHDDILKVLIESFPSAVIKTNRAGEITRIYISKRKNDKLYIGKKLPRLLGMLFGQSAATLAHAYRECVTSGRETNVRRFKHDTTRGWCEYFDVRFVPLADGMLIHIKNVTESVCLEQEFSSVSQQNETANRELYAAMSKLDFRLMELDQAHKKLAALYRITSVVQRTVNVQEVLQEIIAGITTDLGYSSAAVLLIDDARQELVIRASCGYPQPLTRVPRGKGIIWDAVLNRKVIYVPDVKKEPRYIPTTGTAVSEIAIPLIYADKVIGVLDVETSEERPLLPYDRDLLCSLAGQMALTITHAQHVSNVQIQAITDALTGLYNYRYFLSVLDREFKRATHYRRPLSLMMLDIDYFKRYNDTHGHSLGNDVLRDIASIMRHVCRDIDFVFRYGGEEFVVLFPETDIEEATVIAEQIRSTIAEYPFCGEETQPGGNITVSIGVSSYPGDALSDKSLLEHADTALYLAKRTTKNCVIPYVCPSLAGKSGR